MNQISLRTEKGEYSGGETVYGVVYLRIATTTVAQAVKLNFKGFESCEFFQLKRTTFQSYTQEGEPEADGQEDENENHQTAESNQAKTVLEGKIYHFNTSITLWEEKGPLPRGCYVLPFQYNLPPDIPGTFFKEVIGHKIWKGVVKYTVTAIVMETDEPIECIQSIVIQPINAVMDVVYPEPVKMTGLVKKCFCYGSGEVHVIAKLNKAIYKSGELANLEILIENHSTEDIDVIRVSLRRVVRLLGWKKTTNGRTTEEERRENGELEDFIGKPPASAFPEKSDIVWASLLEGCPRMNIKEIETHNRQIDIPLIETVTSHGGVVPLLPSTLGALVRCAYYISVDVDVPFAPDITVILPITAIKSPSNEQWVNWTPPDWINHCQINNSPNECSVRQSILDSEVFAAIPPFQPT